MLGERIVLHKTIKFSYCFAITVHSKGNFIRQSRTTFESGSRDHAMVLLGVILIYIYINSVHKFLLDFTSSNLQHLLDEPKALVLQDLANRITDLLRVRSMYSRSFEYAIEHEL